MKTISQASIHLLAVLAFLGTLSLGAPGRTRVRARPPDACGCHIQDQMFGQYCVDTRQGCYDAMMGWSPDIVCDVMYEACDSARQTNYQGCLDACYPPPTPDPDGDPEN